MTTQKSKKSNGKILEPLNRRRFLKVAGAASAAAGSLGIGLWSVASGRDPMTYTGEESYQGAAQHFNRKRFEVALPPYEKIGPSRRVDARTEVVFSRIHRLRHEWKDDEGTNGLSDDLKAYYRSHPADLELDLEYHREIFPKWMQDGHTYQDEYVLAQAWDSAMGSVWPPGISEPPEIADFPWSAPGRPAHQYQMKCPEKTAELIKQMAYQFGSTLVGITKLNPDWVYRHTMRNRGIDVNNPLDIPKHWEYAIVVGTPMSWDPFYANPTYGSSRESYAKTRIAAYRLSAFIKALGYAARPHAPSTDYDILVVPVAIDAGLGEQGRHGVLVTPELGSNIRPAVVTTNIPVKTDNPISFGVEEFCRTCKICAEQCPTGAITTEGKEDVRGYRRWKINISKCHNFWYSNLGNVGCRLCLTTCPYSRKSNWLHRGALKVSAKDPTGLSRGVMTRLQQRFYPAPDAEEYFMPSMGGSNASYRKPPWWLKADEFIDFSGGVE